MAQNCYGGKVPGEHDKSDHYTYQLGFGNYFSTEAVPDALPPPGRNVPQKCPYDLFSEQLNGTPFVSYRDTLQHVWMYRIRPAVAHSRPFPMAPNPNLEACFHPGNPNIGGYGDPTLKEGLAMHMYSCNASMRNQAFCNNDGDFLILPVHGRLDIQTELGHLMRVSLPDGPSRGYVHEIFGSHFELPDLGVIGSNGLAHLRDFEHPVAAFDIDESKWEVTYKLTGDLYSYKKKHNPFDVVAWHGSFCPYKYAMEKFTPLACGAKEQCDPTIYTVLLAKSKKERVSLSEFAVYTPKHITALDTYRPPYYHRNMSTEMLGMIYGEYHGSVRDVQTGCLSCENSSMPHGDSYKALKAATSEEQKPVLQGKNAMSKSDHLLLGFVLPSLHSSAIRRSTMMKGMRESFGMI
ncbi:RmlC-like cupin domain-containing protein [Clohesyomyces aquaticus]|uniref:homogentisate 1,2-dioxygenase n=1 Tax=Clohesyomyces aquaticus TaxID=1231657 RepID=A0A1Y1YET3_9PLEO|nr:RmlC-like cupin domain-containing protein [Clohesyomyces aquaticus]